MRYDYSWKIHSLGIADKLLTVYHSSDIHDEEIKVFYNINFDKILECIGRDYLEKNSLCMDNSKSLYAYAYDAIVDVANVGNWKRRRWKYFVSKSQIKALRKSYKKVFHKHRDGNEHFFVKIPYNTMRILNTV